MKILSQNERGLGCVRIFPNKTPVYHQGDPAERIYFVKSGVVMTFRVLADSERQITGFCTEGEFFGLSTDEYYRDGAVTVTSAGIQSLNNLDIERDPEMRRRVVEYAIKKVENTQNLLLTLTRKSSEERVASFLLMLAKRRNCKIDDHYDYEVSLSMSRWDIADYLSLSRETVSRRLTDLQADGLIYMPDVHTARIGKLNELRRRAATTEVQETLYSPAMYKAGHW